MSIQKIDLELKTIKCQLVEYEKERFTYYVFQDLDSKEYLMVLKYPNWDSKELFIGQIGYLTYYYAIAGVTRFIKNDVESIYKSTHIAFYKFIEQKDNKYNNNKLKINLV